MAKKGQSHRSRSRLKASQKASAIISERLPAGPAHLARDLETVFENYRIDGWRWRAFAAINLIAAYRRHANGNLNEPFDGIEPTAPVAIPWWAVNALDMGWIAWEKQLDGEGNPIPVGEPLTFDQAFELTARGRGTLSGLEQEKEKQHALDLALMVAHDLERLPRKIGLVIADVAQRMKLSERKIWDAWSRCGDVAKAQLSIHKPTAR